MSKGRVLVTGGAGFVGSHLVRSLLNKGYEVNVIDNLSRNVNNIVDLVQEKEVNFLKGDICYRENIEMIMEGVDYVFHLAAVCINRCKAFPKEAIEVNLNGSYNVFGACINHKVKKVIYTSTSSVFGQPEYLPMDEKLPKRANEPYGATKFCAEQILEFLSQKHDLPYLIVRPFNVYGQYQSTDAFYTSVITLFIKNLLAGNAPRINGSGDQSMDFTHVSDLVRAYTMLLESDVVNTDFNVAPGHDVSIKDLAYTIIREIGLDVEPEFIPREVFVTRRRCDNAKLKAAIDFKFEIPLDEGLKDLAEHIKNNIESY